MSNDDLVLRAGPDGVRLIRDLAYARAFTLRVRGTDQSYVDLDDPSYLQYDYAKASAIAVIMGVIELIVVAIALGWRSLLYTGSTAGGKG